MMQADKSPPPVYDANKNAHLKRRRRFQADLEDLQAICGAGYEVDGLRLKGISPGEDEGSFVVVIEDKENKPVVEANFLISETSDYPKDHSLFCHSLDQSIPSCLEALLVSVVEEPARPLKDAIDVFLCSVADAIAPKAPVKLKTHNEDSGVVSSTDDYWEGSDSDTTAGSDDQEVDELESIMHILQREFIDIVGSSYRPGIIRIGQDNDFVLSVSIPVTSLAEWIPHGALMAWGFLESEHLVLLISGLGGIYPVLQADGTYTSAAQKASATLTFRVGLSSRYKPGSSQACGAVGKDDPSVAGRLNRLEMSESEKTQEHQGDGDNYNIQRKQRDQGSFVGFCLSSHLEVLLNQAFLPTLQYRRRFGLGWAGADALYREMEGDAHQTPEEALSMSFEIVTAAEEAEAELFDSFAFSYDPLVVLSGGEPINLPLAAFSYLLRHLTLCTRYCISCHNELSTDENEPAPYNCAVKSCPQFKTGPSAAGTANPIPSHKQRLIAIQRQVETLQHVFDDEDMAIFDFTSKTPPSATKSKGKEAVTGLTCSTGWGDNKGDFRIAEKLPSLPDLPEDYVQKPPGDWTHDPSYVQQALETFIPPPFESSSAATITLQKELLLTLREQNGAKSLKDLGWYLPTELLGDNLYQWIVEMHSFDPDLPIAKDMAKNNINSIVFEIRFLPSFPMSPPFVRIVTPRLLGFFRGGGGNVTSGGSISWVPSYTIPAILVQIRLAITNTDPRPARLAPNWQTPYSVEESLSAFKRTAGNHGWKLPDGLDKLVT